MAYQLSDLRTRVRNKIKDSSYSSDKIDGFINDAQEEIASLYTWSFFQKVVTGSLTVGEYTFEQQTDHHKTERMVIIHPTNTDSFWDITCHYKPYNEFFELYPAPEALDNSQPIIWTEYMNQIYFNCPSDLAYTLKQFYIKIPDQLETDEDIPELPITFREALVLGAAYRCEEERDNYDIAAVLQQRFNDRVGDLIMRFANETLSGPDTVILPPR